MKNHFLVNFANFAEKCPTQSFDPSFDVVLKVIFGRKTHFEKKHFFHIFFGESNFLKSRKIDFFDF